MSGLVDTHSLKQGLGTRARACTPPVVLDVTEELFEGFPVMVARVRECNPADKPCRYDHQGWILSWAGDFRMSALEEQAYLRNREAPTCDRRPVPGSGHTDLDAELSRVWTTTARQFDPGGLERFDHAEILIRAGILTPDGAATTAGLLALGRHPQQFFPRYVVNLAITDAPAESPDVRAAQAVTLSRPLPLMLHEALT